MGPRSNKKGNPKKYRPRIMPRDLRRAIPDRTESKSILIVCEDSKASPGYFKKLRSELGLCSVNVEIYGEECDSAPIGVVDFAKKRKLDVRTSTIQDGYDEIFCVVDVDDHTTLGDAIQKARDNDLKLIISNPCFEYWHILHFEKTSKAYNSRPVLYRQLKDHLKKNGFKGNIKSGCGFFDIVYPLRKTAIKNSKNILRAHWHNPEDLSKCNPSTDVHRVVECIIDLGKI